MSSRDPDRKGMDTTGVVEYGAKLEHYVIGNKQEVKLYAQ